MQPLQPVETTMPSSVPPQSNLLAPLFKVTPVSKYLALGLFVALPFVGGVVGYAFALHAIVDTPAALQPHVRTSAAISDTNIAVEEGVTGSLQIPENSYLKSARTEIMKGYYIKKEIPNDAVVGNIPAGEIITCDAFVITEGDVSALYTTDAEGELVSLDQSQLPYTMLIPAEETWPMMWTKLLPKSSLDNQIYAAVTDVVTYGGKGLDTCESSIEGFVPFTVN